MTKFTVMKTRSRPRHTPAWVRKHQALILRSAIGLTTLAFVLFLGWGVRQWHLQSQSEAMERYMWPAKERFSEEFAAHWLSVISIPAFTHGNEPEVQTFLKSEPTVEAIVSRDDNSIWIRQDTRFVRSKDSPLQGFYRDLSRRLLEVGSDFLSPEEGKDPDFGWCLRTAIVTDKFVVIKSITPGCSALDAELRNILGPKPEFFVNLRHMQPDPKPHSSPITYGRTPYQIPTKQLASEPWKVSYWTRTNTPGWIWSLVPGPRLRHLIQLYLIGRMALLMVPLLVLGSFLLIILHMRRTASRQAELVKGRLASLTHGLKTPLAVIKAWCDANRHGQLEKDQADLLLIRIGEQVDHLTLMIDNGLRVLHSRSVNAGGEPVTLAWMKEIETEFEAVCSESGRILETRIQGEGGTVNRISLQQVLQTLLENALLHGKGTITFSSLRRRNRLLLKVQDEGLGLEANQLKQLGQPFLHFRRLQSEGFESPGLGLGLSLAIQIAEREGWPRVSPMKSIRPINS